MHIVLSHMTLIWDGGCEFLVNKHTKHTLLETILAEFIKNKFKILMAMQFINYYIGYDEKMLSKHCQFMIAKFGMLRVFLNILYNAN